MAVAIPLLSIAGGISAGMAIAGGAALTLGGALAIGGAMMSGIGLLGKDDDALKIGGFLSAAGGIANALGGGATAASSGMTDPMQGFGDSIMEGAKSQAGFGFGGNALTQPAPLGQIGSTLGTELAAGSTLAKPAQPIASAGLASTAQPSALDQAIAGLNQPAAPISALQQAASQFNQQTLNDTLNGIEKKKSIWDNTFGQNLDAVGKWAKDNKELVNIGANALSQVYSPQAEQLDFQRSIYDRARRNMNSPVRLKYMPGG